MAHIKGIILFIAGMLVFLFLLGWAGTQDYEEQVFNSLSEAQLNAIVQRVNTYNQHRIVVEYDNFRELYDAIP